MDKTTIDYFDGTLPDYPLIRIEPAIAMLNKHGRPGHSLLEIGCGTGNNLLLIKEKTKLTDLAGLDISEKSIDKLRQRLACTALVGSVLDEQYVRSLDRQFDFVVLGAILHHLIGSSRTASKNLVRTALRNASLLVKKNGHLLIIEPTLSTSLAMWMVFYIKKIVSGISNRRLHLFGHDFSNIGAPVVSYYSEKQLKGFLGETGGFAVVEESNVPYNLFWWLRMILITRRADTTILLKKSVNKKILASTY